MEPEGSITRCLALLREGDSSAANLLWERYYPQLVRLARERLAGAGCHVADEEDVALSAMDRFCRAAREGRYPDLADRDGLWRLLLRITVRCAHDLARHEQRQRRGGGQVRQEPAGEPGDAAHGERSLAQVRDDAPTPELAALMAEQCRVLFERLDDAGLQSLALAKLEGYTNEEAARQLDCSVRTVERRLSLIRDLWRDGEGERT